MKLKIINLNSWLLPLSLSSDNEKRFERLLSYIQSQAPDILSLQEIWPTKYTSILEKKLDCRSIYFQKKPFNKSGLFTATQLAVDKFDTYSFSTPSFNLIELIAQKGWHRVEFSDFVFFNTHLYAPILPSGRKVVWEQLDELLGVVMNEEKPVIVVGDFNIAASQINSRRLKQMRVVKCSGNTLDEGNPYTNKMFNKFGIKNASPDFLLLRTNDNTTVLKKRIIRNPLLSDHYALDIEVQLD